MTADKIPPMPQGRIYEVDTVDDEAMRIGFDKAHRIFYELVGSYITRWAHFDRILFEICELVLTVDTRSVAVIFYRTPNISDHLALAHRLIEIKLAPKNGLLKPWSKLRDRIDEGLQARNYVAHQPVAQRAQKIIYPQRKTGKIQIEEAILFIYNEFLKPRKAKWDYIGPDELRLLLKEADALFLELVDFTNILRDQLQAQLE